MTGKPGHWLTPEQSMRMFMLDNVTREQAIAAIVAHLRSTASRAYAFQLPGGDSPNNLYGMPIGRR